MNIKLSVYTNRPSKRSGYGIYIDGDLKASKVSSIVSDNIKEDVLNKLAKGLRNCREFVSHDDILFIEIQNQHLCAWLDGNKEYKGYSEALDEVFAALESLDCRYRFLFVKSPIFKRNVENNIVPAQKMQSMEDIMREFEDNDEE